MKINRTALRTIEILEYISKSKDGCTLLELSTKMDIPKSSAFDIVKTLLFKKMIVEDYSSGKMRYRMGIHSFVIGSSCIDQFDLVEVSHTYLKTLAQHCQGTTFLGIMDDNMVTYIYKYESEHSMITTANLGTRKSVHCTALGKALLAYMKDEKKLNQILQSIDFEPRTEYTITGLKKYLIELEKTKIRGYAIDNREDTMYQICVAAPVFNHNKKVIAAISCVHCYSPQFQIDEIGQEVKKVALHISNELGYREN